MRQYQHREIGEIFIWGKGKETRRYIKTIDGLMNYAVYVAKNNPHICGEWFKGCEVHHKDFNRLNDTPENLIVLAPKEHHKIHSQKSPYLKSVIGWYRDKVIGIWNSQTNASKDTGCSCPSISHYCKYQKPKSTTYQDYKWMFLDDFLADWWEQEMEKAVN